MADSNKYHCGQQNELYMYLQQILKDWISELFKNSQVRTVENFSEK
jgi:hypothetical protein